jgi:hypothetical protein
MNQFAGELAREIDYAESLLGNSAFRYHKGRMRGVRARSMQALPAARAERRVAATATLSAA